MKFSFRTVDSPAMVLAEKADQLAIPLGEGSLQSDALLLAIDAQLGGTLRHTIDDEQFLGKASQSLNLHSLGRLGATRLLLLGTGKPGAVLLADLRTWTARAVRIAGAKVKRLALCLSGVAVEQAALVGQAVAEGAFLASYQFDKYVTGDRKRSFLLEEVVVFLGAGASIEAAEHGRRRGEIISGGVILARDLANEQPTVMCPRKLAEVAADVAERYGLSCTIRGVKECEQLGMGMFLAVGRGSTEEARFIHLTYRPSTPPRRKVALIGKSVTFDSGGLSIKTTEGMLWMKMDMGGGAAVLGAIQAIAQLGSADEVHVLLAAAENMPSGNSYKLGDVLRSMSGKTVEINNTDAEGRLTLGDAMTYAVEKIGVDEIIDLATLTGSSMVALGNFTGALFSNSDALAGRLLEASQQGGDDLWRMPLRDRLFDSLKSDIADMKNSGDRYGGSISAALFLREFIGDKTWAHIDMAGPIHADKDFGHVSKGATGFGVATLVELLSPR
ncbi:MAG TPA: leucyl aminopeptidase [Pseudomonadota bacterium]|nr:leucyl aminopeptidase [Pseudomonadota bacterium]